MYSRAATARRMTCFTEKAGLSLTSWLLRQLWVCLGMKAVSRSWVASVHVAFSLIGLPYAAGTSGVWYVNECNNSN